MNAPDQKNTCSEGFIHQCNLAASNGSNCGYLSRPRDTDWTPLQLCYYYFFWNVIRCSYFWDFFLVCHTLLGNPSSLNPLISIWQMLKVAWGKDTIREYLSFRSICNQYRWAQTALLACAPPSPSVCRHLSFGICCWAASLGSDNQMYTSHTHKPPYANQELEFKAQD